MRLLLIANPVSGGNARPAIDRAVRLLRDKGAKVELALTTARGDAERWAAEATRGGDYERLLLAGGDGTLNEAANGLAGSDLPLAFLPMGTTNVFALEAQLPRALEGLCQLAVQGRPQRIQLGRAGERHFLLMAGIGFDAETVRRMKPALKKSLGKGAYLLSALSTLITNPRFNLELQTENGTHSGVGAIISNCRLYGGPFSITPTASMFADSFEVCLFKSWNRRTLWHHAFNLLRRRPLDPRLVSCFSCRHIKIQNADLPIQIDGDYLTHTPMTFDIGQTRLNMILP